MSLRRTLAASGALVLGGVLLLATPAHAAPSACSSGLGCTYEDANYGKGHINFSYNVRDYAAVGWWVPTNHLMTNDAASSAFNNGTTGQRISLYENAGYRGRAISVSRGQGIPNLGSASLNDRVSSACFDSYCK